MVHHIVYKKNLVVHLDQLHLLLSQFPSAVVDPFPFKTIINEIFFTLANRNIAKPVPSVSKYYKSSIPLYQTITNPVFLFIETLQIQYSSVLKH